MALLDKYLDAQPERKEASFDYEGDTYAFASDDPAYDASVLLAEDPGKVREEAVFLSALTKRKVSEQTVSNAKQIAAVWSGPDKPGVDRLVRLYHRKPDLFLALTTCSGEVLTVDGDLMRYVQGIARPSQATVDQLNPAIVNGLGNSGGGDGKPAESLPS